MKNRSNNKDQNKKNTAKEKVTSMISNYKWVGHYAKKHFWTIVIYTLLGLSGVLVSLLSSLTSKDLVDIITGRQAGTLIKTFIMLIGYQLFSVAISNVSSYLNTVMTIKVENGIKADIYDQIVVTDWESLSKFHSGAIVSRWGGDSSTIANGLLNTVPSIVTNLVRFFAALYLIVKEDWTFALFVLASVPLSFIVSRTNLSRMSSVNKENNELSVKMSTFTQDSFSNIQTVKALDMIKLYSKRLRELQKEGASVRLKTQKVAIVNSLVLVLVTQLVTYSTYGWGIYRVWSDVITYGTMTMFLTLSNSLTGTAQTLINVVPSLIRISNASERLREIVDLPKEDYSMAGEVEAFYKENASKGIGLKLNDISFSYLSGTEVFDKASMDASPREIVGLVGPSGEGKTTMLRLLLSIVKSKEGEAFITAGDAKKAYGDALMPLNASARQLFAYVPQGNSMFPGTIADNMRNVKEDATDEEIIDALKKACAWDFVAKLPEGINSELKERGGGLSEGQAQRLAIARAFIRRSPILLLDEATSALDMDTEKKVLDNIVSDEYPRTCIVTTHRPEVMDICHKVYKIDNKDISLKKAD